jgi:short-subunit dehydrogenase
MPSMTVARMGYRAFRNNRRVMITGARNAFMARLAPFVPRRTLLGLVRYLQTS